MIRKLLPYAALAALQIGLGNVLAESETSIYFKVKLFEIDVFFHFACSYILYFDR